MFFILQHQEPGAGAQCVICFDKIALRLENANGIVSSGNPYPLQNQTGKYIPPNSFKNSRANRLSPPQQHWET